MNIEGNVLITSNTIEKKLNIVMPKVNKISFEFYGADEFLEILNNFDKLLEIQQNICKTINSWFTMEQEQLNWTYILNQYKSISPLTNALGLSFLVREIFVNFLDEIFLNNPILIDDSCAPFKLDDLSEEVRILFSSNTSDLLKGEIDKLIVDYFLNAFATLDLGVIMPELSGTYLTSDNLRPLMEHQSNKTSDPNEIIENYIQNPEYSKEDLLEISIEAISENLFKILSDYKRQIKPINLLNQEIKKNSDFSREPYHAFQNDIEFLSNFTTVELCPESTKQHNTKIPYKQIPFSELKYTPKDYYLPTNSNPYHFEYVVNSLAQIIYLILFELKSADFVFSKCPFCQRFFTIKKYKAKYCSKSCGNKAKHKHYLENNFNKLYHRFRKRYYQLNYTNHKNYDAMQSFFDDQYNLYKDNLHKLTLECSDENEFCKKAENYYSEFRDAYKTQQTSI